MAASGPPQGDLVSGGMAVGGLLVSGLGQGLKLAKQKTVEAAGKVACNLSLLVISGPMLTDCLWLQSLWRKSERRAPAGDWSARFVIFLLSPVCFCESRARSFVSFSHVRLVFWTARRPL
jgi:hypothetical protein